MVRPGDHRDFVQRLTRFRRFQDLQLPVEQFSREFESGAPTLQNAFHSMLAVYTRICAKQVCVEKTPQHLHFVETLSDWYPEARFINMVRDGRDVALSLRKAKFCQFPLRHACLQWKHCIAIARTLERQLGERWMNVRMEDLVQNSADTMQQIMRFLGLRFEPRQLIAGTPQHVFRDWEQDWKGESQQPINPQKIGLFRQEACESEVQMMELLLARELGALGYPHPTVRNSSILGHLRMRAYVAAFSLANTPFAKRLRIALQRAKLKAYL
jgi:hypothetical protein